MIGAIVSGRGSRGVNSPPAPNTKHRVSGDGGATTAARPGLVPDLRRVSGAPTSAPATMPRHDRFDFAEESLFDTFTSQQVHTNTDVGGMGEGCGARRSHLAPSQSSNGWAVANDGAINGAGGNAMAMTLSLADQAAIEIGDAHTELLRHFNHDNQIDRHERRLLAIIGGACRKAERAAEGQRIGISVMRNGVRARVLTRMEGGGDYGNDAA